MSSMGTKSQGYRQDCMDEQAAEGPQPMRNCKPSKTTPNSADQFWQTHQEEYEARGRRSPDRVDRVRRHNAAYPALRDELDRRRSISKVTAVRARRGMDLDSICSECLKKRRIMNKSTLKSAYQGRRNRYKRNEKEYRPNRRRKAIYKNKKHKYANYGCQCGIPATDKIKGSKHSIPIYNLQSSIKTLNSAKALDTSLQPDKVKEKARNAGNALINTQRNKSISLNENESGTEVGSLKSPSTTKHSVTSYNSFPSMDQEPMVS